LAPPGRPGSIGPAKAKRMRPDVGSSLSPSLAMPDAIELPPGRPDAPCGHTLAGTPRKYPRRDSMTGKRPGPTRDRYGPIMEMRVALLRAGGLSVYRIALALKVRRQSVDHILRRPHVAARVEDVRTGLRAHRLLRGGASEGWPGEARRDLFSRLVPPSMQELWSRHLC
jgi:hypothetical protein